MLEAVCLRARLGLCALVGQSACAPDSVCVREDDTLRARGASVREHQALCTYAQGAENRGCEGGVSAHNGSVLEHLVRYTRAGGNKCVCERKCASA